MSTEPDKTPPSVSALADVHFPAVVAVVAEVAFPDSEAVIVPATKLPLPSLITNSLAVLLLVAPVSLDLSAAVIIAPDPA